MERDEQGGIKEDFFFFGERMQSRDKVYTEEHLETEN